MADDFPPRLALDRTWTVYLTMYGDVDPADGRRCALEQGREHAWKFPPLVWRRNRPPIFWLLSVALFQVARERLTSTAGIILATSGPAMKSTRQCDKLHPVVWLAGAVHRAPDPA